MKNLSLNFYGERLSIKFPKDFISLKKEISEKYQISLSDIFEMDISYIKDKAKKIIKTEDDFKMFLQSGISTIFLDINESSKLFQIGLLTLQKKAIDDLNILERLKMKLKENKLKQEKEHEEKKKKIDNLKDKIKMLEKKKLEYVKSLKKIEKTQRCQEKDLISKITKLSKEKGVPLVFKVPEDDPMQIKVETENDKQLFELIQKYNGCINAQKEMCSNPRKIISIIDKQIKELNKKIFSCVNNSENKIFALKREEDNITKEIISLEQQKNENSIPIEKNKRIKNQKKDFKLSLPLKNEKEKRKVNSKIENLVKNLRKNIKDDIEKQIMRANKKIVKIMEKSKENNCPLKNEDEKYLKNCQQENDKALKEVDKWIEYIFIRSHELIEEIGKTNEVNLKKFENLEKKLELNSFGLSLRQDLNNINIGATMPYIRYDSEEALLGGGAILITSPNHSQNNLASQASNQCYVNLPGNGAYAEWTMNSTGKGVTMRFTMPDSNDGMGQNGSVDVYINGNIVKTISLTSYYMWQYFPSGNPSDIPGGAANFAFDEVHFLLDSSLKVGDKIRIQSSGANGLEYGIDFLEIEEVGQPIPQPENSYSVVDFGARPNDNKDDYSAISACIQAADAEGKDVYFPPGTYHINQIWRMNGENIKISGAGIWYTNIQFTNDQPGTGGISGGIERDGYCKNVEFCNMYINSNLRSRYYQQAVYKCFMDVWSNGSIIHDIWEEHFECGFWLADYSGNIDYSDGLKIVNCRIRNNLADGVNFCQGTSNSIVYNCSVRNNGDDGLAMWNDFTMNAKDESNNIFCYNTIEFIWRAGGIAIYGGNGHKIYNNYIRDTHMSSGIHLNTTFNGHKFSNNLGIEFANNMLIKTGSVKGSWGEEFGAIDLEGEVKNITFNNTYIYDAQHDGLHLGSGPSNILFNNLKIYGTGTDGQQGAYSSLPHKGAAIQCYGTPLSITIKDITLANIASKGTMYGSTEVGNYINLTNVTINGETDLDSKLINYPEGPKNGTINTNNIIIPEPFPINNIALIKQSKEQLSALSSYNESNMKITSKISLNDNKLILPKSIRKKENKNKAHYEIICNGCNTSIIGIRYKCVICKDFDYCEKCEDIYKEEHGHPLLKINSPEMCPVSIKCVLNNEK